MFEPLAAVLGDAAGSAQPEVFYYNNDPNGCPHRVLDATGQIVWSATYSAWGEVLALQVNRFDNPLRYQGQYYDGETGLSYNRFRYYDAKAAQYISPDAIRLEGGGDLYAYCANPYTFIDPLGLKCEKFIRFVSEAEAKAMEAAMAAGQKPGLLPRPQGKGAFSRAAKWISELGHGRNPKKLGEGYTHKVEMELDVGASYCSSGDVLIKQGNFAADFEISGAVTAWPRHRGTQRRPAGRQAGLSRAPRCKAAGPEARRR